MKKDGKGGRNNTFDYSKAKRELGYSIRPHAETLADESAVVRKLITNRDYVRQVAAVKSADELEMLADHNFESVSRKLGAFGLSTSRENFDLINDIVAIAQDNELPKLSGAMSPAFPIAMAGGVSILELKVSKNAEEDNASVRDMIGSREYAKAIVGGQNKI